MIGTDDDAVPESPGIEPAFIQIEGPVAQLARQQASLQPLGESPDEFRETHQLAVRAGAQRVRVPDASQSSSRPRSGRGRWCRHGTTRWAPRRRGVADRVPPSAPVRAGAAAKSACAPARPRSDRTRRGGTRAARPSHRAARPRLLRSVLVSGFALAAGQLARLAGFAGGPGRAPRSVHAIRRRTCVRRAGARVGRRRGPALGVEVGSPQFGHGPCRRQGGRRRRSVRGRGRAGPRRAQPVPRLVARSKRPVPAALLDEGGDVGRHARHPAPQRPRRVPVRSHRRPRAPVALQIVQAWRRSS